MKIVSASILVACIMYKCFWKERERERKRGGLVLKNSCTRNGNKSLSLIYNNINCIKVAVATSKNCIK